VCAEIIVEVLLNYLGDLKRKPIYCHSVMIVLIVKVIVI